MISKADFAHYVRRYVNETYRAIDLLRKKYGNEVVSKGPNRPSRPSPMPTHGTLDTGEEYYYHGNGFCLHCGEEDIVDFEFGPDGRYGGFDHWRLLQYIRRFRPMTTDIEVQQGVLYMLEDGTAVQSDPGHRPILYYLAEDEPRYIHVFN